jgi:hypothetical protein
MPVGLRHVEKLRLGMDRLRGSMPQGWGVERLQGWHLPLLQDPAFLPFLPQLQRALMLELPERLLGTVLPSLANGPVVHVALLRHPSQPTRPLGLIVTRRLNRRGTCWEVDHLALAQLREPFAPSEPEVAEALMRAAIQGATGVSSWIATASILDGQRQAFLRAQGFQQVRSDQLWQWQPHGEPPALPPELRVCPLNRQSAAQVWHLEQSCCPAHLRQIFDRRIDDLLDQSKGCGWLLLDHNRNEAVAAIRHQIHHPEIGVVAELSFQPGRSDLYGAAGEWLLHRLARLNCGRIVMIRPAMPGWRAWAPASWGNRFSWRARSGGGRRSSQRARPACVWRRCWIPGRPLPDPCPHQRGNVECSPVLPVPPSPWMWAASASAWRDVIPWV